MACPNPYLRLFYQALEPVGVTVAEPLKVNDDWLRGHAATVDAIHIHWPETIWRPTPGARGTLKRIVGLLSFLRLAGRLGIKRVWTVHNIVPHEPRAGVDFLGTLALARSADLLICHSEESADAVRRRYRPRGTLVVMQHGNFAGVYPPPRPREVVLRELGLDPNRPWWRASVNSGRTRDLMSHAPRSSASTVRFNGSWRGSRTWRCRRSWPTCDPGMPSFWTAGSPTKNLPTSPRRPISSGCRITA